MADTKGLIQDPMTYRVCHLQMLFKGQILANGSGFFWQRNGKFYLITNWHNLSGREPIDGSCKSTTGGLPNEIRLDFFYAEKHPKNPEYSVVAPCHHVLPICDENITNHQWYEHSAFGRYVDIAALELPATWTPLIKAANDTEPTFKADLQVTQEVFIVGYPLGMIAKDFPIPIWKRATIAAEPLVDLNGEPKIYVDTASRSGMSGSLAIARFSGFGPYQKLDGSKSDSLMWKGWKIIGIYSGRLSPSEKEIQLGIIWRSELIDEVIDGAKRATA